ncbi:unnamed protein product [Lathyrus sativus]|nr:unnamed protein product [Lathyrus sativus]
MGFGSKWLKWIKDSVLSSYMSVIVNGSQTQDFKLMKGLRQGDPLSPFLITIVVEGLAILVRRAAEAGILRGFEVIEGVSYNLLQYTGDTMLICEVA